MQQVDISFSGIHYKIINNDQNHHYNRWNSGFQGATFYLSHDQQEINITEEIQISAEGIADVYSTCNLTTSLKDFKENKVLDNTQVSRKIVLMVTNSPIPFDKSGKARRSNV